MGIRQNFRMDRYNWNVVIYYTVDDNQKTEILHTLKDWKCEDDTINSIEQNLTKAKNDTGFTYSSFKGHCSIIVIHKASSVGEFINTFEHEKNHLEMHICEALNINPYSEDAAHLSGYLAQMILEKALYSIVEL